MNRTLSIAFLVFFAAGLSAADKPKPLLTEKELADGWIALFDGESTYGWDVKGSLPKEDGALVLADKAELTWKVALPAGTLSLTEGGKQTDRAHAGGTLTLNGSGTFTRILYKPADTKSLFNGKDLTGWKVFADPKRANTKFEVTKDGELHASDGPGDLQTESMYADFVLQFECKTNGNGLNSGVFFRCLADQYQNGYEFQIQNSFLDGDRTKPKDAGTGAIYRRQPARKVVANDKEWTYLTLVARGPTFATWVNGVPVCVWTDDRPKDENPRKGLRFAAGHLSIQGHDKTTDLLFRNIRIVEIK